MGSLAKCFSLFLQWHRVSRFGRGDLVGVPTSPHNRNREGAEAEQWPSLNVHGWPQSQVQGASHAITGFEVGLVRRGSLLLGSLCWLTFPSSSILAVILCHSQFHFKINCRPCNFRDTRTGFGLPPRSSPKNCYLFRFSDGMYDPGSQRKR